jgi:hypothetical protein
LDYHSALRQAKDKQPNKQMELTLAEVVTIYSYSRGAFMGFGQRKSGQEWNLAAET